MFMDLEEHIEALQQRAPNGPDLRHAKIAQEKHFDLRVFQHPSNGRWELCSLDSGLYANKVEIGYLGQVVWAAAYLEEAGYKIYQEPPYHNVGYRNQNGFGDVEDPDWWDYLEALGWDIKMLRQVKDHFKKHAEVFVPDA